MFIASRAWRAQLQPPALAEKCKKTNLTNSLESICFFSPPQKSFTYLTAFIPSAASILFCMLPSFTLYFTVIMLMKMKGKKMNKSCTVTFQYCSNILHQLCCLGDIIIQIFLTAWLQQLSNPQERLGRPKKNPVSSEA